MTEFSIPSTGIKVHEDGSMVFDGPEAVNVYRYTMLRRALKTEIEMPGFKMVRGSIINALKRDGITTKSTKRGAYADLNAWMVSGGAPDLPLMS